MADSSEQILSALSCLKLGSSSDDTERSDRFWNGASVAMKFSVEWLWLHSVWKCKDKPNYGMRNLDGILKERASNKLELTGPLIDSYLRELGKCIFSKLGRSRNTALMPPVKMFVPYAMFWHLCNVTGGYGGSLKTTKSIITVTMETFDTAAKCSRQYSFGEPTI